jgi:hypothetical protein
VATRPAAIYLDVKNSRAADFEQALIARLAVLTRERRP